MAPYDLRDGYQIIKYIRLVKIWHQFVLVHLSHYLFHPFQAWKIYLTVILIEDYAIFGTCYFSVWSVIHTFPCIKTCRIPKNLELSTLQNFHYAWFYFHIQTFFCKVVFPINFDLKTVTCSSSQFQNLM